jgi:hypothetical protein
MSEHELNEKLKGILTLYKNSFSGKTYAEENDDVDSLMAVFGITPSLKRENRQYWGRELGMCWQLIVSELFRLRHSDYKPAIRIGSDEPCDFCVGADAVDTKYRIGSGDSGTLKKFKSYGQILTSRGFRPVLLIARTDNLPAAIAACEVGGWTVLVGQQSFDFICKHADFDLEAWLRECQTSGEFAVQRPK